MRAITSTVSSSTQARLNINIIAKHFVQPHVKMKPTEILSKNTEDVADSLHTMIQRELTPHSCSSYDGYLDPSDPTITITADDRERLVDWCYGLVEHCQFSTETVASAMEMVDRFLSTPSNSANAARVCDEALRDRTKFQLVTVAALYISVKINERVAMSSDELSAICGHSYTAKEIEDMEHTLLCGLSWRCYTPTAQQVGLSFLSLIFSQIDIPEAVWSFILDEMTYLIELAVQDYYFSTQRRSTVALAAIINVMSDSCIEEYQKPLERILSVIMPCFDLDQVEIIQAATRRLRSYADAADEEKPIIAKVASPIQFSPSTKCVHQDNQFSIRPDQSYSAENGALYYRSV